MKPAIFTNIMDRVESHLKRTDALAPAPQVLPQLLKALREENSDVTRIVDLIAFDPGLTAKVLRACNSAYFGRSQRINEVSEAIHVLGFHAVYQIVAAGSASQCIRSLPPAYGIDSAILWRHSVTTAFAAQFVAEEIGLDAGMLFTAGLLHDVGKTIMAEVYKEEYGSFRRDFPGAGSAPAESERVRFGVNHADAGARLMERWKFSSDLVGAVRFHHKPDDDDKQGYAACIQLADAVAHQLDHDQEMSGPEAGQALAILGLDQGKFPRLSDRVRENLEFVEALVRLHG